MHVKQVTLISFSPTGTTQKVLESIARGIAVAEVGRVDLTLPAGARQDIPPFSDELVLLGIDLAIPGRFPFQGGIRALTVTPATREETCTLCGTCAAVCPTAAVAVRESVATASDLCIRCSACIKNCPAGARSWQDDTMKNIAGWLHEHCAGRKEPQLFGI